MLTSDVTQPRFFLETFSETGSWILRNETGKISKAGRYYLVGFSPEGRSHPERRPGLRDLRPSPRDLQPAS